MSCEKKDKCRRRPDAQHLVTKTWFPGLYYHKTRCYYETCDCDEGDEETASQGFTATGDAATPVLVTFLIGCGVAKGVKALMSA